MGGAPSMPSEQPWDPERGSEDSDDEIYLNSPHQIRNHGVADLDGIVRKYAWKRAPHLGILLTSKSAVEIIWDRVKFTQMQIDWVKDINVPKPPNTLLYSSAFTNNTDRDAEHTLRIERSSTAMYKTLVTNGFSRSIDLSLSLDLPEEVAMAAVEFDREVQLNRTEETTRRQKQTWSVDTKIPAPPRSLTKARVEIQEDQWKGNFSTVVVIKGLVVVNFSDSVTKTSLGTVEDDIVNILLDYDHDRIERPNRVFTSEVQWVLEGSCDFTFGVEQRVLVDHEDLIPCKGNNHTNSHYK